MYKFSVDRCEFTIRKEPDAFTVRVKSTSPLPVYYYIRVDEALRFLLAQSIQMRVLFQPNRLELIAARSRSSCTTLPRPIARGTLQFYNDSWPLFAQYLTYVNRETSSYWHPCSGYLHYACESSANSIEAFGVGLSVAVEGLAGLLPLELSEEDRKELTALRSFIVNQVTSHADFSKHARRIESMLAGLTQIRAIDRF